MTDGLSVVRLRHRSGSRYEAIARWLTLEGRVDVLDLAARLGVAQETVRRDLRAMEDAGQLERVHGGAVALDAGLLAARAPVSTSDEDDLELSARVWAQLPRRGTVLIGTGRLTLAEAVDDRQIYEFLRTSTEPAGRR